jgi:hypothetical protein
LPRVGPTTSIWNDLEPALGHDQTIGVNIAGIDQMGLGEPLCLG